MSKYLDQKYRKLSLFDRHLTKTVLERNINTKESFVKIKKYYMYLVLEVVFLKITLKNPQRISCLIRYS